MSENEKKIEYPNEESDKFPNRDDFANDLEYTEAIIKHTATKKQDESDTTDIENEIDSSTESHESDTIDIQNEEDQKQENTEKPEEKLEKDDFELPTPDIKENSSSKEEEEKEYKNEWIEYRHRKKELKLRREETEREIQQQEEELVKLQVQNVTHQLASKAPNRDDFSDDVEYTEALVKHTLTKKQIEDETERNARQHLSSKKKFIQELETTCNNGAKKYSNFDEMVEPLFRNDMPSNVALVQAINDSKFGPDILYMLGKNKLRALEIARMSPVKAVKWVFETERRFEDARARSKTTPAPIKVMQKVSSKLSPTKDISQMSVKEYRDFWNKKKYGN